MQKAIVSYVSTPHRGYIDFFRAHTDGILYILGRELIAGFAPLHRHLPGNAPEDVLRMIWSLGIFDDVRILTPTNLEEVRRSSSIIMPDEDVSRHLVESCFKGLNIVLDGRWRLRWHKDAALAGKRPEEEGTVTAEEFALELMGEACIRAAQSPDWWRQIGAVLVRDREILLTAYNVHFPTEHSAYILGDPRSNFEPGERIDVSLALHAEMNILSTAAREGIRTKGCDLFVTTFPCPPCAYAVANSGIRRLYYAEGYSLVAGAEALNSRGVEIIRVLMPPLL